MIGRKWEFGDLAVDRTKNNVTIKLVMNEAVRFFKALADTTRWRIVRLVRDRAMCVCELADILEMPQSSVSSHVQIIRKAGMLESERCGKWTYFRVSRDCVSLVGQLAKRFPDGAEFGELMERAEKRLARRAESCCPGPVKLGRAERSKAECES